MHPVAPAQLIDNLSWRYAVKKFDPSRELPPETLSALERAVVLSPSSFGLQPWRVLVIRDAALRARLREASWNQSQVTEASRLFVFARRARMSVEEIDRHVARVREVRGTPPEMLAEYRNMMVGAVTAPTFDADQWAARQAYIALGMFLCSAAQLGVDACPMEGFDASRYDEILGLPAQGFKTTVIAAVGYRAADDWLAPLAKVRFPHEQIIEQR